ncbi:MAG TPA: AIR synthase-related protein, partial [Candidatus Marinimicrobia bacterium]|nr:AIR synthase-related protein [Candidatus Neomarinimicrobiota bacterium]
IIGNTSRIVPENLTLKINWQAWEWPPLFQFIQKTGEIDIEEMRRVFNLGIGMIIVCAASAVDKFSQVLQKSGERPVIMGEVY